MLKIAVILLLGIVFFRWALGQWPWQMLKVRPTRSQALFNARRLLRVEHGASRQQILAAHKRLISMVHPDKGGTNAQVHEANDARDLLLDELPGNGIELRSNDTGESNGEEPPQD
ncbi:molecular chaperone DnaJ [Qipengyuania sp. ASV99]|uniref:molecular chaperone DnaJ n=1 Tax=Qipengyuania sp. ASV99 TaxID=3399681 RepID=UPI003A4C74EF